MRILYIIQFFGLKHEAGSSRPYALARTLVRQGHEVTVLCGDVHYLMDRNRAERTGRSEAAEEFHEGIRVVRVSMAAGFRRSLLARLWGYLSFAWHSLRAALRLPAQDVVLTSIQPIFVGPIGWLVAWRRGAKFVLEVRDVWPDVLEFFNILKCPVVLAPLRMLERFLYARAVHLFCLTPGIVRNLRAKGVPAAKLSVTPTGVETELFAGVGLDRREVRARLGWGNKFIAIYAGSMARTDAVSTILEAARILRGRADLLFVMIGEGDFKPSLQQWAGQENLANVRFLPIVPRDALVGYLGAADIGLIGLFDNPYADLCLQNKFFDYLGAGLPSAATLRGDQQRAIAWAGAGLCVPPEDAAGLAEAVARLADDPALRQRMAAGARRAAEGFARGPIVAAYGEMLARIARGETVRAMAADRWPMFEWESPGRT